MKEFISGLQKVIPKEGFEIFTPIELQYLISGDECDGFNTDDFNKWVVFD